MSSLKLLQAIGRCENGDVRPLQVSQPEVPDIVGHERLGAAGNRQFHKMIIAFIAKIGPPSIENLDPPAPRRQSGENLPAFSIGGFLGPNIAPQQILMFEPQSIRENRLVVPVQRPPDDLSGRSTAGPKGSDEHVGIDNDHPHDDSIYAITLELQGQSSCLIVAES